MKRILNLDKRLRLLFALLSLTALALLAIALQDFSFLPAVPFWSQGMAPLPIPISELSQAYDAIPAWRQVSFWLLLAILVSLLTSLLSPELRKRLIRSLFSFIATVWVISYLMENRVLPWVNIAGNASGVMEETQTLAASPPAPVFLPPEIPSWQTYLTSFGLVLFFFLITWALLRWRQRNKDLRASARSHSKLASIARSSLKALSSSQNAEDVILRCYAQMNDALEQKRGLVRHQAMTPAEFARRLEQAGLPGIPVQRLTRLFEAVRYGARKFGQIEINEAVSCLTAILNYYGDSI